MPGRVEPIGAAWRASIFQVMRSAKVDALIACPFVQQAEAEALASELTRSTAPPPRLTFLTDLKARSALAGALDVGALICLTTALPDVSVVSLPGLHAKVYVADTTQAIVTSANLTRSGLDRNYEYGVLIESEQQVAKIRRDLERYAALGSVVRPGDLASLHAIALDVSSAYRDIERSATRDAKRRFRQVLASAEAEFLGSFVGTRTKNAVFSDCIRHVLRLGPLTTQELHDQVQKLVPDLCDNSRSLMIRGHSFGKSWKHDVRNAQVCLRRSGAIRLDHTTKRWQLVE